jgi:hypothetical protein
VNANCVPGGDWGCCWYTPCDGAANRRRANQYPKPKITAQPATGPITAPAIQDLLLPLSLSESVDPSPFKPVGVDVAEAAGAVVNEPGEAVAVFCVLVPCPSVPCPSVSMFQSLCLFPGFRLTHHRVLWIFLSCGISSRPPNPRRRRCPELAGRSWRTRILSW